MNNIKSVLQIPCTKDTFFKYWFTFLKPFHKLTEREIDVISSLVKQRYELSKVIKDKVLLEQISMNEDTKRKVREECGITPVHFQVIMAKLKKSKVIENDKINPRFIPRLDEDANNFQLLLTFNMK